MNKPSNKYFAAANSYNGFVSYFAKVFGSKDFDRIYVLKGGPGTGKSSFMKEIKEEFSHHECGIDEIYCSSDPNSLDGIIIKHKERKIAILDGTAPHERDAVIPGAVDEIINLGEGWKKEFLIAQRDKILEIGQEKSNAYSAAYSYLKIAGAADRFIIDEYKKNFLINEAKTKAETIFAEIPSENEEIIYEQIISSFGRLGYYFINDISDLCDRKIHIMGNPASAMLFIDICIESLRHRNAKLFNFPSALNSNLSDGFIAMTSGLGMIAGGGNDIDADEYVKQKSNLKAMIKSADQIKSDALEAATRWFAIASDMHFRLEEIYSAAMDFQVNNEIIRQKTAEIKKYLEITS